MRWIALILALALVVDGIAIVPVGMRFGYQSGSDQLGTLVVIGVFLVFCLISLMRRSGRGGRKQ